MIPGFDALIDCRVHAALVEKVKNPFVEVELLLIQANPDIRICVDRKMKADLVAHVG